MVDLEDIKARMRARGVNQADLANLLGLDPTAVSKRLTGKREFKHAEIVKLDAWLGTPEVPITGSEGVRLVPIIGQVAAGRWREAIQQPLGHIPVAASSTSTTAIALRVQGDSMDLEIADGGVVIVDPDDKGLFPGRLYVVLNSDGETTFKQFEVNPARFVPRSTNPAHKVVMIGEGEGFTVVGRVTALSRAR
jgi:SOS-response transcriptional repressor LexA